jgi:transcriptional regulator with XRE-family HTH domain
VIAHPPESEMSRTVLGICRARQWTYARLGVELGVSENVIANWVRGRSQPNLRDMPLLRGLLHGADATVGAYLVVIVEIERSLRTGTLTGTQARVLKQTMEQCLRAVVESAE